MEIHLNDVVSDGEMFNTGTTARYAKMLGQETNLPVYSTDEAKKTAPEGAEIIYLGWIMAGKVKGYKATASRYHVRAVCGVCMGKTGSQLEEVRKKNVIPDNSPVFTLQGGFDINKLHGIYRLLMSMMNKTAGKALAEKADRTPDEDDMPDMMQHGGERVNVENLRCVLDWYEQSQGSAR